MKQTLSRATLAAAFSLLASAAGAQQGAPVSTAVQDGQTQQTPATVSVGSDGFVVQSADGDYRLQFGVLLQADGRFSLKDEDETFTDDFDIRKLRTYIRGRIARNFEFYVNPDFAGGSLVLQDAYIDTRLSRAFVVRFGKAKTPFGTERLVSDSGLLIYERALPSQLVPNRDIGLQILGELHGGLFAYMGGILNGVADGASGDADTNDAKDLAGRVVVRPFVARTHSALNGLRLAMAGTTGNQSGAPATLKTTSLGQTFVSYAGDVTAGRVNRVSPAATFDYKRVSLLAEFVHTDVPMQPARLAHPAADTQTARDIGHDAWQIAGAYLITSGRSTADRGVVPVHNFDFGGGHWGTIQLAARYHALTVDDDAFVYELASPASSQTAKAWTVNVNWYLTQNVKYVGVFERTVFGGTYGAPRTPENALAFRAQVAF